MQSLLTYEKRWQQRFRVLPNYFGPSLIRYRVALVTAKCLGLTFCLDTVYSDRGSPPVTTSQQCYVTQTCNRSAWLFHVHSRTECVAVCLTLLLHAYTRPNSTCFGLLWICRATLLFDKSRPIESLQRIRAQQVAYNKSTKTTKTRKPTTSPRHFDMSEEEEERRIFICQLNHTYVKLNRSI